MKKKKKREREREREGVLLTAVVIGLDAESTGSLLSLSLCDSKSYVLLNHNNFVESNKQRNKNKKEGLVAKTAESGVMMGFVGSTTDGYMVLWGK